MDILFGLILGGVMLYVVLRATGLLSSNARYARALSKLTSTVTKLENIAAKEERKAEQYIAAHLSAKEIAAKARTTATNIGNLFA